MSWPAYQPVYAYQRGGQLESLHYGAIAVVSASGELLAAYGDEHIPAFLRSAAKPFQALPFVLAGGVEHYGLTTQELAVITASHSGTDQQVAVVASLQQKTGVSETALQCGIHSPYDKATARQMEQRSETLSANRNNCSGKHSGMLAHARMRGWLLDTYLDPKHPLQLEILSLFGELASLSVDRLALGTDGCSAPNWAAPLYNTALAYARLADPAGLPAEQQRACKAVSAAMRAHPDLVGGPGRFDTALMQATKGRILSKGGAEGFAAIGLPSGALDPGSSAIGIALKIADGDARAQVSQSVALEILRQLGALSPEELQALEAHGPRRMLNNHAGLQVGEAKPAFDLENQ